MTLHHSAAQGDLDGVRQALADGTPVDLRDEKGRTALLVAAAADQVEVAQLLLHHGADVDAMDHRHDTPWLVTGVTGSVEMGQVLLAADADLTVRNRYGGVSIIPASERGHVQYVRWVSTTGIDVNHVNDIGWTALLEAVILGDGSVTYEHIVSALLDAGADPHLPDRDGVTPLLHAHAKGHARLAAILEEASS